MCVGTSDEDRPRRRARAVNAVTDGEDDEAVDQRRVDRLQNLLEQATKGIVAMAAKKGATGADKSGRSADQGKSSSPKGSSGGNSGRGRGADVALGGSKILRWILANVAVKLATGSKTARNQNHLLRNRRVRTQFPVSLCRRHEFTLLYYGFLQG